MSKAAYTKAALTYLQQLQQLKDWGFIISDEEYFFHLPEIKGHFCNIEFINWFI